MDKGRQQDEPQFSYRVEVRTAHPGAVKVLNVPYAERDVPLSLDLVLASNSPLLGRVVVEKTDLSILRRSASLNRLRLTFDSNWKEEGVMMEGRADIQGSDYLVHVTILGTIAEPHFTLESEPPLAHRDLIGVVLYDRAPDVLSDEEKVSADNASAAMAENAIGLVSMYYLAATPVESVRYNPRTDTVSIRVRLGEGLSLFAAGEADEVGEVGLRRRLGRDWFVETKAVMGEGPERGVALLTWARRY